MDPCKKIFDPYLVVFNLFPDVGQDFRQSRPLRVDVEPKQLFRRFAVGPQLLALRRVLGAVNPRPGREEESLGRVEQHPTGRLHRVLRRAKSGNEEVEGDAVVLKSKKILKHPFKGSSPFWKN